MPPRVIKETQCGAIKLEGGRRMGETIRFLTERGIPVMAHIGLTPQSINVLGGFKTQGRTRDQWAAIEEDARIVAEAGAFCRGARGHGRAAGRQDHQGAFRSRPSASAPRRNATVRSW